MKWCEEFIKFAVEHANNSNRIKYQCIRCDCLDKVTVKILRDHLFIYEIYKGYRRWIWHVESTKDRPISSDDIRCVEREEVNCNEGDKVEDMMHDIEEYFVDRPDLFKSLNNDAKKNLYILVVLNLLRCLQC